MKIPLTLWDWGINGQTGRPWLWRELKKIVKVSSLTLLVNRVTLVSVSLAFWATQAVQAQWMRQLGAGLLVTLCVQLSCSFPNCWALRMYQFSSLLYDSTKGIEGNSYGFLISQISLRCPVPNPRQRKQFIFTQEVTESLSFCTILDEIKLLPSYKLWALRSEKPCDKFQGHKLPRISSIDL